MSELGILLDKLDALGIADNTLVIVTSDNGGHEAYGSGGEGMIDAGQDPNGPLRAHKGSIYEGGHRVPFIWRWGDGSAEKSVIAPGVVCNQLVSVIDWVPSMIDLVGDAVASDQHYDSVSLLPLLFSEAPDAEGSVRTMHHYYLSGPSHGGARMDDAEGKWFFKRNFNGKGIELYDLATDISQATNLIAGYDTVAAIPGGHTHKARVTTMNAWYEAHNTTHDPRTGAALDYAPPSEAAPETRVVSINLNMDGSSQNITTPYGVETSSVWSKLRSGASGSNYVDDTGAATTLDAASTNPGGQNYYGTTYSGTPMHTGPAVYSGTSPKPKLTLTGIPYAEYDIIVYLTGFTSNTGASISDGVTTYYYQTPAPQEASLVQTTHTSGTGIPVANYAIFSGLSGANQTLTIDQVSGGGAGLGGVQIVGESGGGASHKTPVPVPVPTPELSIDGGDLSLSATELEGLVSYEVRGNDSLSGDWTLLETIPTESGGTWTGPGPGTGARYFYRLDYPMKIERFVLPVGGP